MAHPFERHLPGQDPGPEGSFPVLVPSLKNDGDPLFHFPIVDESEPPVLDSLPAEAHQVLKGILEAELGE